VNENKSIFLVFFSILLLKYKNIYFSLLTSVQFLFIYIYIEISHALYEHVISKNPSLYFSLHTHIHTHIYNILCFHMKIQTKCVIMFLCSFLKKTKKKSKLIQMCIFVSSFRLQSNNNQSTVNSSSHL
jgi:hypothetical protein